MKRLSWRRRSLAVPPRSHVPRGSRTFRRGLPGLALVLFAVAASIQAQDTPQTPEFQSVSSELVVLPVTVTGSGGRFVTNLPESAFHVLDNGMPQKLDFFSNEDV